MLPISAGARNEALAKHRGRTNVPGMQPATRRHRSSATPVNCARIIRPHEFDERYLSVLLRLDPHRAFKYATIPWLHFLCRPDVEYSVFRRYLGYLRQAPNRYLRCPEQQNASPNVPYKTLVYELGERGRALLQDRGLIPLSADYTTKRSRAPIHRAHSYYHEMIVDLGYFAPLYLLTRQNPHLRLVDFAQLLVHENVPALTRSASDPLLVTLKRGQTRFDGTPHVIVCASGAALSIGIPGIEVDRGTETFERVEAHIRNAVEYIDDRHHANVWGFDNCMIPFLFTSEARKVRAMAYLTKERGAFPFLLFKTVPDIGLLRHFPKPQNYDPSHVPEEGEPRFPETINLFATPWSRAGCPEFRLDTFEELT